MVKLSTEDYREALLKSKLVDSDQLDKVLKGLESDLGEKPDDPQVLSERLEKDGLITRWQNEVLLEGRQDALMDGRHAGFFLGSYKLLGHLGTGGMNSVFLAEHIVMRRRAAIKVLPLKGDEDKAFLERFQRESQATAALDHPNIVRAHDFATQGQVHYLVMEHVDGKDLQRTIKDDGVMEYEQAAQFMVQASLGLHHAHEAGMVHRDIKPANLLVDRKGVVKLLDLGVARLETEDASLTKEHKENILGTADYLAPEQAIDSHNVDARADIYSLGCTLYFMLTGHPPFPHGSLAQRMLMHQIQTPTSIYDDRSDAPEGLVKIIEKMMAKKPEERYQTAMEVHQVLSQWVAGAGDPSVIAGGGLGFGSETDTSLTGATELGMTAPLEDDGAKIHCSTCYTGFNPQVHRGRCPKCGSMNEVPTDQAQPGGGGATADLMGTELTDLGSGSGFAKGLGLGSGGSGVGGSGVGSGVGQSGGGSDAYDFGSGVASSGSGTGASPGSGSGTASFGNSGSGVGSYGSGTAAFPGSGTASLGSTGQSNFGNAGNYDVGQPAAPAEPEAPQPSADVPHADGPVRAECTSCGATYSAPWRSCLHCGANTIVTESDSTDDLEGQETADVAVVEAPSEESAADWSDEYSSDQFPATEGDFESSDESAGADGKAATATRTAAAKKAPAKGSSRGGPLIPMVLGAVVLVGLCLGVAVVLGVPIFGEPVTEETWPNGQVKSRGQLVDGKRQGEWTLFDESGQITETGLYKDDKKFGQWSYFDDHGQLVRRGSYQEDQMNGKWVFRYKDGQNREEGDYRQDQRHGRWIFWRPDGNKLLEAEFKDGVPTGTWMLYDEEGNAKRYSENYPPVPSRDAPADSPADSQPPAKTES